MDLLQAGAVSYNLLLHKKFTISAGAKNKKITFSFIFKPVNFYHLIGYHYLSDMQGFGKRASRQEKEMALKRTLSNDIVLHKIAGSSFYNEIADRVAWFHRIDGLVAHIGGVFGNQKLVQFEQRGYSQIKSGYVLYEEYHDLQKVIMLFLTKDDNEIYQAESFIVASNMNKLLNQKKFTILHIASEFSR